MGKMLPSKQLCIITLFYALFHSAHTADSQCKEAIDLYRNKEKLHFVGEMGDLDFGLENVTKSLHCCAAGFTKIEWLKDNKPYPWSPDTSTFVIVENTFNQSLISKKTRKSDSAVYTCIVSNGPSTITRDIKLEILNQRAAYFPRMTYATKDQHAEIGDFVRLYCEGYVGVQYEGHPRRPVFHGTITWEKGLSKKLLSRSFIDGTRVIQMNHSRDENQILGSYLIFMKIQVTDMDMYTCRITVGNARAVEQRAWIVDSPDPEGLARVLFMIIYAILPMLVITFIVAFITGFATPVELIVRRLGQVLCGFGFPEMYNHILVIYHADDEPLMTDTIIPKFLNLNPVNVTLYPIQEHERDISILRKKAKSYDGIVVIMTLSLTGNDWSCERLNQSIRAVSNLHKASICVFTRKLPPLKGRSGRMLKETLKKLEVHVIQRRSLSAKMLKAYLNRMNRIKAAFSKPCGYKKKSSEKQA